MAKMRLILLAACFCLLQACAHSIHQVYVSSMDKGSMYTSGKWLTVEEKEFVILGFQMETTYVQRAYRKLEEKCSGRLSQVTAEHLTSYFLLSYDQKVVLKGLCNKG